MSHHNLDLARERLYNRYTALQLADVCACVTGLQHVERKNSVIMRLQVVVYPESIPNRARL